MAGLIWGAGLKAINSLALLNIDKTNNFAALPIYHRNVFNYLIDFLKELLLHSADNKLDAKTLAMCFGSILIRENAEFYLHDKKSNSSQAVERKKHTFIHHFLVNDYE